MSLPATRRAFVALAAATMLMPRRVRAQATRMPVVGLLIAEDVAGQRRRLDALLAGLREAGWHDGATVVVDVRTADGAYDRLAGLARELVRRPADVIVAFGIKALVAAREATPTLPIVIPSTSSDPVELGLIDRLSRQKSNITGSITVGPEVMAKRLELVREAAPGVARVAVVLNAANAASGPVFARMERSARALGLALARSSVRAPRDLPAVLDRAVRDGARALVVQDDTMFAVHARMLAQLAVDRRVPAAGPVAFAEAGGLLGYGADDIALYRRGAYFVDRILRGAAPGDLPIEQATRFELAVNSRTARALGHALPASLLVRTDKVIE